MPVDPGITDGEKCLESPILKLKSSLIGSLRPPAGRGTNKPVSTGVISWLVMLFAHFILVHLSEGHTLTVSVPCPACILLWILGPRTGWAVLILKENSQATLQRPLSLENALTLPLCIHSTSCSRSWAHFCVFISGHRWGRGWGSSS